GRVTVEHGQGRLDERRLVETGAIGVPSIETFRRQPLPIEPIGAHAAEEVVSDQNLATGTISRGDAHTGGAVDYLKLDRGKLEAEQVVQQHIEGITPLLDAPDRHLDTQRHRTTFAAEQPLDRGTLPTGPFAPQRQPAVPTRADNPLPPIARAFTWTS